MPNTDPSLAWLATPHPSGPELHIYVTVQSAWSLQEVMSFFHSDEFRFQCFPVRVHAPERLPDSVIDHLATAVIALYSQRRIQGANL
jgi:hypothetical protein